MKYLILLALCVSCNLDIKHKGLDNAVPERFQVEGDVAGEVESTFGPNLQAALDYCTGKVDHDIAKAKKEDPEFEISEEDRQYEIDECYYNFDFSGVENL